MHTKILQRTLLTLAISAVSCASSAATIPYGVFDKVKHNDYSDIISAINNQEVNQIDKVEEITFHNQESVSKFSQRARQKSKKLKSWRNRDWYSRYKRTKSNVQQDVNTDSLLSANSLTITGASSDDERDFTSGTWSYTGNEALDWLVIKYGQNFGIYQITDGDTSGEWNIAELEEYLSDDATGAKVNRRGKVRYSSFSHATAYSAITPVPVPAAGWLFASGLIGMIVMNRGKKIP